MDEGYKSEIGFEAVGDFVKIVTGRDDKKLAFANVEVYANKER